MLKRSRLAVCLCLMFVPLSLSLPAQDQQPAAKPQGKALKVTISYEGKGKVDKSHGIYLFLFDTPDFVQNASGVVPIAFQSVYSNGETVTISGLTAENVYMTVAYDEAGNYSLSSGPPPSGSPVALYKPGDPQPPTAVKLEEGKAVEVKFSFDDSFRMP